MYNDIITLLTQECKSDKYGDLKLYEKEKEIFCKVKSISQSEFYQGQSVGLKPEIKFVIADYYDYENEKQLLYENQRYDVIRTYRNGKELEITCKRGIDNAST